MKRPWGRIGLAIFFALLAANALAQVVLRVASGNDDPIALAVLQFLVGSAGLAAAWTSWQGSRSAPAWAVIHGGITAAMLASLGPLLGLDAEERSGILVGAGAVALFGVVAGWYLRRSIIKSAASPTSAANGGTTPPQSRSLHS